MKKLSYYILALALMIFSYSVKAQSAKKCFENAGKYEAAGQYEGAMLWYLEGMKGNAQNKEYGFQNYVRTFKMALQNRYRLIMAGTPETKIIIGIKADSFIVTQRAGWASDADKLALTPDWQMYKPVLDNIIQGNTSKLFSDDYLSFEKDYQALQNYLATERTNVWQYTDKHDSVKLSPAMEASLLSYKKDAANSQLESSIRQAQANINAANFKDALYFARVAKYICDKENIRDQRANDLINNINTIGKTTIAVIPFGREDQIGQVSKALVNDLRQINNPLLQVYDNNQLESLLLQNNFTIDDIAGQDIIKLTQLGAALGVNVLVIGKVIQADMGYKQSSTNYQNVFMVHSDEDGIYTENMPEERVTEISGSRTCKFKMQIKMVDLRTKEIKLNETVDYELLDKMYNLSTSAPINKLSNQAFSKMNKAQQGDGALATIANTIDANMAPPEVYDWRDKMRTAQSKNKDFYQDEEVQKKAISHLVQKMYGLIKPILN